VIFDDAVFALKKTLKAYRGCRFADVSPYAAKFVP
jgi:hypothetical protein